jgi:hypothetical protein
MSQLSFLKGERVTTQRRAICAVLAGAATGAILTTLSSVVPVALTPEPYGGLEKALGIGIATLVAAFCVWALGILSLGVPIWLWAHGRGLRSAWAAITVGAVLPFIATTVLGAASLSGFTSLSSGGIDEVVNGHLTLAGWGSVVGQALLLALAGALIAMVIWRVAYWPMTSRRRLFYALIGPSLMFCAVCGALLALYEMRDTSCHNEFRDGRRSISAEFSVALDIGPEDWPSLRTVLARYGVEHGFSVRDKSLADTTMTDISVSLCTEKGPTISIDDFRFMNGDLRPAGLPTTLRIYLPRGGEWRTDAVRLSAALEAAFPGHVLYQDGGSSAQPRDALAGGTDPVLEEPGGDRHPAGAPATSARSHPPK